MPTVLLRLLVLLAVLPACLRAQANLYAWGHNGYGQCNVPQALTYVEIWAGGEHAIARRSDGTVVAWGRNVEGQCNMPALAPGLSYARRDVVDQLHLHQDIPLAEGGADEPLFLERDIEPCVLVEPFRKRGVIAGKLKLVLPAELHRHGRKRNRRGRQPSQTQQGATQTKSLDVIHGLKYWLAFNQITAIGPIRTQRLLDFKYLIKCSICFLFLILL